MTPSSGEQLGRRMTPDESQADALWLPLKTGQALDARVSRPISPGEIAATIPALAPASAGEAARDTKRTTRQVTATRMFMFTSTQGTRADQALAPPDSKPSEKIRQAPPPVDEYTTSTPVNASTLPPSRDSTRSSTQPATPTDGAVDPQAPEQHRVVHAGDPDVALEHRRSRPRALHHRIARDLEVLRKRPRPDLDRVAPQIPQRRGDRRVGQRRHRADGSPRLLRAHTERPQ